MDSLKDFETQITKIADYAFSFGSQFIQIIGKGKTINQDFFKENLEMFLTACYGGQKIAQDMLINEISSYQSIRRSVEKELKEVRRNRNKELEKYVSSILNHISYRLKILQHIADSIAWILIRGEIHTARRLYMGDKGAKYLDSNNLQSLIKVVKTINREPLKIALISDITSYIQVGDLLIVTPNSLQLAEVKEGKVNTEILELFDEVQNVGVENIEKIVIKTFDEKKIKQMKRMIRQHERASNVVEIIETDKGFDPKYNREIKVLTPNIHTVKYYDKLNELIEVLESKSSAYICIDNCLHIGMYRDEGLALAKTEIEQLIRKLPLITFWLIGCQL